MRLYTEDEAANEALQQLRKAFGNESLTLTEGEKRSIFHRARRVETKQFGISLEEAVEKACFGLYQNEIFGVLVSFFAGELDKDLIPGINQNQHLFPSELEGWPRVCARRDKAQTVAQEIACLRTPIHNLVLFRAASWHMSLSPTETTNIQQLTKDLPKNSSALHDASARLKYAHVLADEIRFNRFVSKVQEHLSHLGFPRMNSLPSLVKTSYEKLLEAHHLDSDLHLQEQAGKEASRIRDAYIHSQRPAEAHTRSPVKSHINALDLAHPSNVVPPQAITPQHVVTEHFPPQSLRKGASAIDLRSKGAHSSRGVTPSISSARYF